ncbi:MAG: hypothetical protein WCZ98_01450 [Sideroxydans sp.]
MTEEIKNQELSALLGEAALVDAGSAPTPQPTPEDLAPPVVQQDRTAEVAMLFGVLRPAITMAFPVLKDAPDSEWLDMHEPVADLLNHYQVDVGEWIKSPWVKLAFAAMPLAMRGFNAWMASNDKKPEAETTPAAPQVIAPPVVDGPAAEPRA